MRATEFRAFLASMSSLTSYQRRQVKRALEMDPMAPLKALLEERQRGGVTCPRCASKEVIRWGRCRRLARWRCKSCRRTFNELTGTALAGLHYPKRWVAYAESLRRGETLSQAAQRTGVHRNTAHRWRHRFLGESGVRRSFLHGIAEADETLMLRSFKGQPALLAQSERTARKRGGTASQRGRSKQHVAVLVMRDRSGNTVDGVLESVDSATLRPILERSLPRDAILCTDGWSAYGTATQQLGLAHEVLMLSQGERVRGPFHIQNVNNYHSRFKTWLARFHGVSTLYLPNYLGWFRTLDRPPSQDNFMLRNAFAP